jgi:hypothetical protein
MSSVLRYFGFPKSNIFVYCSQTHSVFNAGGGGSRSKNVKLSRYRDAGDKGERYTSYSFFTTTLDGSEWSVSRPGRALLPVPIGHEAEWTSELVWTQRLEEKSFAFTGDQTPVVQSVVRHYTD